jgi:RIO kinase 1
LALLPGRDIPRPTPPQQERFFVHSTTLLRTALAWPQDEPYEDHPRGTLKSGKEAEIFLVERRFASGPRLLAHKRYRPRYPVKGELKAEGFSNSTLYRGDSIYKASWFLPTRDKRALMGGTRYGHELAGRLWPMMEWTMLRRAWEAGASVPYPVEQTDHGLIMEFVGDDSQAAPKLAQARLTPPELASAWEQLVDNLRALTVAGLVHADLSAYNLLWWEGKLVVIDLPQAVEFTTNADAYDLLHRDVANVAEWFTRHGLAVDGEALYAELLALAW